MVFRLPWLFGGQRVGWAMGLPAVVNNICVSGCLWDNGIKLCTQRSGTRYTRYKNGFQAAFTVALRQPCPFVQIFDLGIK